MLFHLNSLVQSFKIFAICISRFPNPEEGKSALDLAVKTAEANGSTLILANDPDADRLAAAEKNKK